MTHFMDHDELRLILASASPRRAALLQSANIRFEQIPASIDESMLHGEDVKDHVIRLALEKAQAVWKQGTRTLGADTVVVLDGEVFGKPCDEQHACKILRRLSGRTHQVMTGVALIAGQNQQTFCEETSVEFHELSQDEIDEYVASGEPLDKAGAYAIQGAASRFVKSTKGSYSNVVGLPLNRVIRMLS